MCLIGISLYSVLTIPWMTQVFKLSSNIVFHVKNENLTCGYTLGFAILGLLFFLVFT